MNIISLHFCSRCGVPHVPPAVAERVRRGENIEIEIVYPSGVAGNVLKWGTGALNIDGCRVHAEDSEGYEYTKLRWKPGATLEKTGGGWNNENGTLYSGRTKDGRWPANVLHDGSDEVVRGFPETQTNAGNGEYAYTVQNCYGDYKQKSVNIQADSGSAARFFYSAKADADDRLGSKHPTIKPVDLIQYLTRLVTPPRGTILDCFAGTGTTGEAAWREGFNAVLIEREEEYCNDIRRRMALCLSGPAERKRESNKARTKDKPVDHGPLFGAAMTAPPTEGR